MAIEQALSEGQAEVAVIADLAKAATGMEIKEVQGVPVTFVPENFCVHEFGGLLPQPKRARGAYEVETRDSFTDLVTSLSSVGTPQDPTMTRVYVAKEKGRIVAVVNDQTKALPHWADLRVGFTLKRTVAWQAWVGLAKAKYVTQFDFAEFLDDWRHTIVTPDSAFLLEVAQNLQGHKNADWQSGKRLSDGSVQFGYVEEIRATQQSGIVEVPGNMTLLLPVFHGEDPVAVPARLRWDLDGGRVRFRTVLPPIDDFEQLQIETLVGKLHELWPTSPMIVYGAPPAG